MIPTTHDEPTIIEPHDTDLGECPRCCWQHAPGQLHCKGTVVSIVMEPLPCGCVRKMQRRERWAGSDCVVTWQEYGDLVSVCAEHRTRKQIAEPTDDERANLIMYGRISGPLPGQRTGD